MAETGANAEARPSRELRIIRHILSIFLAIMICYLMMSLASLLVPLALALFLAILMQPILAWLERRRVSGALSLATIIVGTLGLFGLIGALVYRTGLDLVAQKDALLTQLNDRLAAPAAWAQHTFGVAIDSGDVVGSLSTLISRDWIIESSGTFAGMLSDATGFGFMTVLYFVAFLSGIQRYESYLSYVQRGENPPTPADTNASGSTSPSPDVNPPHHANLSDDPTPSSDANLSDDPTLPSDATASNQPDALDATDSLDARNPESDTPRSVDPESNTPRSVDPKPNTPRSTEARHNTPHASQPPPTDAQDDAHQGGLLRAFEAIKRSIVTYMKLKFLISLLTGGIYALACWIFGVDFALFWGFLAFLLNFIPTVGSIVASLPPLLLGAIQIDGLGLLLAFAAVLFAVQTVIGNVVEPRVMGSKLSLNTVTVLLGLVFWGKLWGGHRHDPLCAAARADSGDLEPDQRCANARALDGQRRRQRRRGGAACSGRRHSALKQAAQRVEGISLDRQPAIHAFTTQKNHQ